jgi:hypothetical protein
MTARYGAAALGGLLAVILGGCGLQTAAQHPGHASHRHHVHGRSGRSGHSGTGSGAGTGTGDSSPPPPNTGSYQDLSLSVIGARLLGTAKQDGAALDVYQLKLQVYNSTPAIIVLALDDFSVEPAGGPTNYSWNDLTTTGLTASTSLFWPVAAPATPASVTATINAGATVTGLVNVEVPAASSYDVVWGAPSSGDVATTFTP